MTSSQTWTYEHLLVEPRTEVLDVWLNRPESRNAMNDAMEAELLDVLDRADDDRSIKVVTLRGKGPVFSAGHDLKESAARRARGDARTRHGRVSALYRHNLDPVGERAWYCRKTLIAGVRGYVGPAARFMLDAFDFVLAEQGTRFGFEQARMGSSAAGGYITPFLFPMRVVKQFDLIGAWMDASDAKQMHYVQRVLPAAQLDAEVDTWAQAACALGVDQIAAHKESIHRRYEIMGLTGILGIENHEVGPAHSPNADSSFHAILRERGMHEALRYRESKVDPSVARV